MKNPLESPQQTALLGVVLAALVYYLLGPAAHADGSAALGRWLHIVFGIAWIGLLYYLNLVQVPALKDAGADGTAAGITKHIAPRALFFFRWAALITWLTGAWLLGKYFMAAFTLAPSHRLIGIGAWLGTIMLFNVWVLIWPNQKKVLGLVSATDAEKNKARRTALLASRTNFMLSLPMLLCMAAGAHPNIFGF